MTQVHFHSRWFKVLVPLLLFVPCVFAQTWSHIEGDRELTRLGIRAGLTQERVKSILKAAGYEPWECTFSSSDDGTHYAQCLSSIYRQPGRLLERQIGTMFTQYRLGRDRDTGELVKQTVDKLIKADATVLDHHDHSLPRLHIPTRQEEFEGYVFHVGDASVGIAASHDTERFIYATTEQLGKIESRKCVKATVLRSKGSGSNLTNEEMNLLLPRLLSLEYIECPSQRDPFGTPVF